MEAYGWHRPKFGPFGLGFVSLGQDAAWTARAQEALAQYDALVRRAADLDDDEARGAILAWVGDGSEPGSPSDQYRFVHDDVASGASWDEVRTRNVVDLEAVNAEFRTRVADGEKSGTYGSLGPLSIVTPQGRLTSVGVGLVAVAALGLLVVPVVLK